MGAEIPLGLILAGAGVSTLGTVGSMYSASQTNKANKQMAAASNDLQREMFYEQNVFNRQEREAAQLYNTRERLSAQDFNTAERREAQQFAERMWNLNNEYNSPAAQADRLRAAGFNPANSLGDAATTAPVQSVAPASSSGASVSPASAGSFGSAVTPEMQNVFEARMLTDNINSVVEAMSKQQDIIGKSIDNETRSARNRAEIDSIIASKEKALSDASVNKFTKRKLQREIDNLKVNKFILEKQDKLQGIQVNHAEELIGGQLQQMYDAHDESLMRQSTQRLMNMLSVRKDSREEVALKNTINETRAKIADLYDQIKQRGRVTDATLDKFAAETVNLWSKTVQIKDDTEFYRIIRQFADEETKGNHEAWKLQNWYETDPTWQATDRFLERLEGMIPFASGMKSNNKTYNTNVYTNNRPYAP